jgi:hypothetical protein
MYTIQHAYNPSYSGGRDQEDRGSKPVQTNSSPDPIYTENLKIKIKINAKTVLRTKGYCSIGKNLKQYQANGKYGQLLFLSSFI